MTSDLWLRDVGAFSLQVAAVVAAGAGAAVLCGLGRPRATLLYWRALLFACLVLPLCQPWQVKVPPREDARIVPVATASDAAAIGAPEAITASPRRIEDMLITVLVAGIALRAIWLAMGALALRRLRRSALPLVPLPSRIRDAQIRVGASGHILMSDRASGPMTFGVFRPVVLLPTAVGGMAPHVQEAIAYHELIHVGRRDWLDELFEEAVRTIFWFHPAVWWLVGRIRLSREQVVDQEVIRLTGSREGYVDALLVVALAKPPLTLVPAPAFLRRSLLKKRVAHIMQETTMTTRRLILSLAASAVVVGLAGAYAVRSFPLLAQARVSEVAGAPVQVAKGGEHLMHGKLPEYPRRAIEQQVEGDVILDVAVDDRGEVSDARVVSGPDELRRAALESVLHWHYAPAAVSNTSTQVVLHFQVPPPEAASQEVAFATTDGRMAAVLVKDDLLKEYQLKEYQLKEDRLKEYQLKEYQLKEEGASEPSPAQQTERLMVEIRQAIESPQTSTAQRAELKRTHAELVARMNEIRAERERAVGGESRSADGTERLALVRSERVSQSMVSGIMTQAGVTVGDTITEDIVKRLRMIASKEDEHIRVEAGRDASGGVVLTFITR